MNLKKWSCGIAAGVALSMFGASARADDVGPDAYGYTATNTVPYAFRDIVTGNTNDTLTGDDSVTTPAVDLGFKFAFYGTTYSSVTLSTNGVLEFGGSDNAYQNVDLSAAGTGPSKLATIAVAWDDWKSTGAPSGAGVYYRTDGTAGSRVFTAEWNTFLNFNGPISPVTFEASLFEGSNNILMQYQTMETGGAGTTNGASATVGIVDAAGGASGNALQWSYNSPVITDGEAIQFSLPPQATATPLPRSATAGLVLIVGTVAGGSRLGRRTRGPRPATAG